MKIKNIYTKAILMACVSSFASCSQEDIEPYSGVPAAIYIQEVKQTDIYGNPISYQKGSAELSFSGVPAAYTYDYVSFKVRLAGEVVDYDRAYTIKVDPEKTDAIENVDYDLSENTFSIRAGANSDTVNVKVLRNDRLLQNTLTVSFKLEPNENFTLAINDYKNSSSWNVNGEICDATTYYVQFSEKYNEPNFWTRYPGYFGEFSAKKFAILNGLMGWTPYDWNYAGFSGFKVQVGKLPFAADTLRRHLQQKADEGDPVCDENGEYMQLDDKYAVDYSKYL